MAWLGLLLVLAVSECTGRTTYPSRVSRRLAFLHEPSNRVDFSNTTGTVITCSAEGDPQPIVSWELADGSLASTLEGIRQVRTDGSLVFLPFRAEQYRRGVHDGIYRCVAANSFGRIRSRGVHVKAVVLQGYEVHVHNEFVIQGNTAVLRCYVPSFIEEFVKVTLWIRDDGVTIGSPGESGDKYAILPTGELLVKRTTASDAFRNYHCQVHDRLSGVTKRSSTPGKLTIKEPYTAVKPRITESRLFFRIRELEQVYLPCISEGHPPPHHWWFKRDKDNLSPLQPRQRVLQNGEVLLLQQASVKDSGTYVCFVNNTIGEDRASTELIVTAALSVEIDPSFQAVDVGRRTTLSCKISGHPVQSVHWFKDGRPLVTNSRVLTNRDHVLEIYPLKREDKGMYQCFAQNTVDSAQGTAELFIAEDPPAFVSTFKELSLSPGMPVSLKCSASGNPLPQITWTLDGVTVPEAFRVRIGDYVNEEYNVNSYVNISSVTIEDAGTYTCIAKNEAGEISHSRRLHVLGPPYIRSMRNLTALASRTLTVHCPVAGYPIDKIFWERESRRLPQNHRQKTFPNGTLSVQALQTSADSGQYTCVAEGKEGRAARRDVFVTIMNPPAVGPFNFPLELTEGQRAAVACVVSAGDLPIKIKWLKDGRTLSEELRPMIGMATDFTSSLSFPSVTQQHTGNYTCVATNPVASANYTAPMVVHVPPKWTVSPIDKAVIVNQPVTFDCQASAHPPPVIRWLKASEGSSTDFQVIISSATIQSLENGSLAIVKARKEDAGRYMCQAVNGVGPGISVVIQLTVHVAAHVQQKLQAMTVKKGERVAVECKAMGDRPLSIVWTKDRHTFNPNLEPRYVIEEHTFHDSVQSTIVISTAERKDSSLFTCHANNAYGKDEANFQIVVRETPDPPKDVYVSRAGSRSLSVTWSAPYSGNSPITRYLLEYRLDRESWDPRKLIPVDGGDTNYVISRLLPQTTYQLRVRAENALGSSLPSEVVSGTTEDEAPGGPPLDVRVVATSSSSLRVTWKPPYSEEGLSAVEGYYVGYKVAGHNEPFAYKTIATGEGNMHESELTNLQKFTKFSIVVQAFNRKGAGPSSEEVIAQTLEFDPPSAPYLKLVSSTASAIHLAWEVKDEGNTPVTGYIVFHKTETSEWTETLVPESRGSYTFRGLNCGQRYQFYILSYNKAGRGQPSDVISAKTEGTAPVAPDKRSLLRINATSVTVLLSSWMSGGCPITFFVVQYKPRDQREWVLVSNNVPPDQKTLALSDLMPATWYTLFVTSHNDAGTTEAEYVFATLTVTGVTVSPLPDTPEKEIDVLHHLKIIIPVVCTTVVLVIIVTVACVIHIRLRNNGRENHSFPAGEEARECEGMKVVDSVPMSVWEKRPQTDIRIGHSREQLYFPSPYATSRISVFSTNGEFEGGPQSTWRPETTVEGEHTYEIPFPSKQNTVADYKEFRQRTDALGRYWCRDPGSLESPSRMESGEDSEKFIFPDGSMNSKGYIYLHPLRKHHDKRRERERRNLKDLYHVGDHTQIRFHSKGYDEDRTCTLSDPDTEDSAGDFYELSDAECDMYTRVVCAK